MRIRPFIEDRDYVYLERWIENDRTHALWCAGRMPYPLTRENLHNFLKAAAADWTTGAYVATEDAGKATGFFCYSVNTENNAGFFSCIIVDPAKRGKGYGKEMLQLALRYAFDITKAESVHINVFAENAAARHCYEKIGFVEQETQSDSFRYKDELWSRCHMMILK